MFNRSSLILWLAAGLILAASVGAQEFPIVIDRDSTFSASAVYGGTSGIVAILGDTLGQSNLTAQLVYPPDSLIGPRISIGRQAEFPGALTAFDGTNYLLVWRESDGMLNGQFVSTAGSLVGGYFNIASGASLMHPGDFGLAFNDTSYLVIFVKAADTLLYGQRVSKSGSLIGGQIQISGNQARDVSLAYDGTNYLTAWVKVIADSDKDIYGQFLGGNGSLTGSNFLIDGGPNLSDNPTGLAFDGSRYLLVYHEKPDTLSNWTLVGQFITTAGTLQDTIVVCDSTLNPGMPSIAFDGTNYLITWSQYSILSLMGRFWAPSGSPVDTPFVVFDYLAGRVPMGGCGFGGGKYLAVCSRMDFNFTDGDVYGRFLDPLAAGVTGRDELPAGGLSLSQSYPNPAGGPAVIRYQLAKDEYVELKVFDMLGREVKTLASGRQSAGSHSVRLEPGTLPNGLYIYRLQAGEFSQTKKLLLMR